MATTTNYSWTTPDDTALVKDGAAAIRSLGTAIDTTVFTNAGNAINKTIIDAAGDLIYGTAADTAARLAIGTTGQVLTVSGGVPAWAAATGSGMTLINTGGTSLTGATTSITSIPGTYKHLYLVLKKVYFANTGTLYMTLNNDGTNNYSYSGISNVNTTISGISSSSTSGLYLGVMSNSSTVKNLGEWAIWIPLYTDTNSVSVHSVCKSYNGTSSSSRVMDGIYDSSAAVTSIELFGDANFSGGTAYLYGVS
jgi:hypothetical protein